MTSAALTLFERVVLNLTQEFAIVSAMRVMTGEASHFFRVTTKMSLFKRRPGGVTGETKLGLRTPEHTGIVGRVRIVTTVTLIYGKRLMSKGVGFLRFFMTLITFRTGFFLEKILKIRDMRRMTGVALTFLERLM